MEWAVLLGFALVAAALVVLPRGVAPTPRDAEAAEAALHEERRRLLDELVEIDDDVAAGRIAAEDRAVARRAIAPRLREVTQALQARGVEVHAAPSRPGAEREASR